MRSILVIIGAIDAQRMPVLTLFPLQLKLAQPVLPLHSLTLDPPVSMENYSLRRELNTSKVFGDFRFVTICHVRRIGWTNIDGFTFGGKETTPACVFSKLLNRPDRCAPPLWSNLDYITKKGGHNPDYIDHSDGKGRVSD